MEISYLDVVDPQRPFFEVWADGEKLADLIEPAWEEMFWCSYKLIPTDQACEHRLRQYELWDKCKFEIRNPTTGRVVGPSLAGGSSFHQYCENNTDRIDFRSLWPGRERSPKQALWKKLGDWFNSILRRR